MTLNFDYSNIKNIRDVCCCIYKITNIKNNKIYIGKSKNKFFQRIYKHSFHVRKGTKRYLYNAIRKYGWNNFSINIVEKCSSLKELNEKEIYWIDYYKSNHNDYGYNLTIGGDGGGSAKELVAIAKSRLGKPLPQSQKDKISLANKGRSPHPMTSEIKNKISKTLKGKMPPKPIHLIVKEQNLKSSMIGYHHTDESKKLMSLHNDHKCHIPRHILDEMSKNWMGSKNPLWINISKDELISAIKLNLSLKDTAIKLGISKPTVYVKIKLLLGCQNLIEAREMINEKFSLC